MKLDQGGKTRPPRLAVRGAAGACVVLAALAVLSTYPSVSQTIDEATHVAAGLEWLDAGSYRLHPETPPLARALLASGPFLAGARAVASLEDRNAILAARDTALPVLWYARLANLVPLVGLALLVFGFAARCHDPETAALAVLLLVSLPPLLAHAGLATTDVYLAATHTAALFALLRWLEQPTGGRSALLGLAVGLAVLCKFSALPFLAASFAAALVARRLWGSGAAQDWAPSPGVGASLGIALAVAPLVIWAGYRFSIGPVQGGPPIPAPELVRGLGDLLAHNQQGHLAYLLGETRMGGWWYFFPVALAVKTPLPFLALVMVGVAALLVGAESRAAWQRLVPPLAAAGLLVATFPSRIDIGLRHLLPVYPLLAIVAASGAMALYRTRRVRSGARAVLALLLVWQLVGVSVAHPAHLAYFNVLAGDRPEEILVDSDLDWGQDVDRLVDELERRGIEDVSLLLFTTMGMPRERLPRRTRVLQSGERASGWVAASLYHLKVSRAGAWLESYAPVAHIGDSILLYDLPESAEGGGAES